VSESAVLSRPVELADVPAAALEVEIVADDHECAMLAAAYDLAAVKALSASATLTRDASGGLSIEGRVVADIVQTCVVSLVPVDQHIDEPMSLRLVPPGSPEAPKPAKPGAEVVFSADEPEPPEILAGPTIDLGAMVEEAFVLAIDPYPHAPGAVLSAEAVDKEEAGSQSPFAALAGLVTKGPPKG
jgi:uncharacterized metal-binding protein YceD (DUF177 family)